MQSLLREDHGEWSTKESDGTNIACVIIEPRLIKYIIITNQAILFNKNSFNFGLISGTMTLTITSPTITKNDIVANHLACLLYTSRCV